MSNNVLYYENAALDSKYNKDHWFRYLRKFIISEGCKLSDSEIQELLSSSKLTMYQKVTLKRAVIPGTPTNLKVIALNQKTKTPRVEYIRRKLQHDTE